ncbi:MAG: cytidine deaminase [Oscillospiraceae bacterium]|jgi:cytidine deaminase
MTHEKLVQAAQEALPFAYAPYSNFQVGAALLCADGTVYTGCNVENAAFGAGICAERVALGKAVSEGKRDFLSLAVVSRGDAYCVPCGICRQMFWEFSKELLVLCANGSGAFVSYSIKELLPHAFGDFRA